MSGAFSIRVLRHGTTTRQFHVPAGRRGPRRPGLRRLAGARRRPARRAGRPGDHHGLPDRPRGSPRAPAAQPEDRRGLPPLLVAGVPGAGPRIAEPAGLCGGQSGAVLAPRVGVALSKRVTSIPRGDTYTRLSRPCRGTPMRAELRSQISLNICRVAMSTNFFAIIAVGHG